MSKRLTFLNGEVRDADSDDGSDGDDDSGGDA